MVIAILPHGQLKQSFSRLADYPLWKLEFPLGERPQGEIIADLTESDHLIVYSGSRAFLASRAGMRCKMSILLLEPPAIQYRYYQLLGWIGKRYHRILTHNSDLLSRLPNARFVPHGGTFLNERRYYTDAKRRRISLIASKKNTTEGHRLRHKIASWSLKCAKDLNLYGYGYNPVEDKSVAHAPYWFSVVVENSRCCGYFTEKLIDSLLCRSLPVYWGAPDIAHFFDTRGMICCHSESEIFDTIPRLTIEDYQRRLPYLEENARRALEFANFHYNAATVLAEEQRLSETMMPQIRVA